MEKPDIGLIYPDYFEEEFGNDITKDIKNDKLNLKIRRQELQVWNSYEWVVPGLIATYLFKPYFEAFLNEAGKDHYHQLKKYLSKLLKFTKELPVKTLTSNKSVDKVDKKNTQSKAISIHIELKDNIRIKLMFDSSLTIENWLEHLDSILEMVQNHYENYPNDKLTKKLEKFDTDSPHEIFAVINKTNNEWEFLNLQMTLKRSQQ